jgi:hypothetical protein
MRHVVPALPLLLCLATAARAGEDELPRTLSLADERRPAKVQDEGEPQRPQEATADEGPGVMEYITRNSELELGMLVTDFDGDLRIESDLGWYVRTGVRFAYGLSAHVTYRHYEFSSSELPGKTEEDISLRALLVGASFRQPLSKEFALLASAAVGFQRWESNFHQVSDDADVIFSGELAATARLWTVLRLKLGVVYDLARTDFHQDSKQMNGNLSWLVGFELGL